MKILFVTSEASPYVTSGGLGEVMGALPKALKNTEEGIHCDVILPLYKGISEEYKINMQKVCDISFDLSWRKTGASIYKINDSNIDYYFIENNYYCDRRDIYGEYDDGERFAFFSTAVIEFILSSDNIPDVLHANDWQSALSVIYLKTKYSGIEKLSKIKTLYTIHNIEYQGKYDLKILYDVFGINEEYKPIVEYDGCINLMKGAIVCADAITTVSNKYAEELEYDYYAFGLSRIIQDSKNKMYGVINGIDYDYYSPEVGGDIYSPYTRRAFKSGKAKNKRELQIELGLEVDPSIPLAVMITRLATQKGIELFLHIAEELLQENIQIAVLGSGDTNYETALRNLTKYPNFKAIIKFDRTLSKKLYASGDMFLMPSKYEPCGLAQMIAMSYGTIPIARAVGGLYDTIVPYGNEGANGFLFENYNAHELLYTVKLAMKVFEDKKEWASIVRQAIKSNFDWNNSASGYISIYKKLLNLKE